jgi:NADH:ubiquinone oxidoreductase subunit 5 (subunit L)/multisubunit Na+/H+ antiporter MnhA subunit
VLFTGIGLAIVFHGVGMQALAALALIAVLYHSLNHAFMKSLLFLGTGAVLHATGERNLGRLGGLIHRMPWAGWLTLVGVLAIAGLPPLNGFVSEWLLLQTFLFSHEVPRPFVNMLLPLGAAVVALAAALAGYVMVKFFGIIFLGQPREPTLSQAHDVGGFERAGLLWLAIGCVLLGLLPNQVIGLLGSATTQLVGTAPDTAAQSWWMLAPLAERAVSYSPLILLAVIAAVITLAFLIVRAVYRRPVRRAPPWDCGFARLDPRMQDTAEGFGQPIRHIFEPFFAMERELPSPLDAAPRYRVTVTDRIWRGLYVPIGGVVQRLTNAVAWLQQGRISVYLTYSFITLLVLLAVML